MSTASNSVRMTKAATLRAAQVKARTVGKEATKPKPGPAPKKVTPPTYEQQDQETGEVDEPTAADSLIEEEEEREAQEEKHETRTPPHAPKKGSVRSKASESAVTKKNFAPTQKVVDAASLAPHMSVLSLVSDYKPIVGKPAKATEYLPSCFNIFAMASAVASLLAPIKSIHKADPTYNTVFSRLALSYVILYIVLCARRSCNLITYEEEKVLKKLEKSVDMDSVQIPGPYVLLLSCIGFHLPADSRFEVICPTLPSEAVLKNIVHTYNTKTAVHFPHFPSLLYLANLVAAGEVETTDMGRNDADDDDTEDFYVHWDQGEFVVLELQNNATTGFRLWNRSVKTKADKAAHTDFLQQGCATGFPFYEKRQFLKNVSDSLPISSIPFTPLADISAPDLLSVFGLKGSTRWLPVVFESLEFECKFFKGTASVRDIGFERGQDALCYKHVRLAADAVEHEWFPTLPVEDDGSSVFTKMENVSDGDMAVANYAQTIVTYEGGHVHNFLRGAHSVDNSGNVPKNQFNPFNSHTRKVIKDIPTLTHRFRSHIKTEMMLEIDAVLTSL